MATDDAGSSNADGRSLGDYRFAVATTVGEVLGSFADLGEVFIRDEAPENLEEIQDEALDTALVLNQLTRITTELIHDHPTDAAGIDLRELLPLLQAFAESYVLIGLAPDWVELREQPLVTPQLLDRFLTPHVLELLGEAAEQAQD